jgi:hypothetical protein
MKTALLLTGAAARISQEVAIIDELREKRGLRLSPSDTFLAGFSSGALNIAAINACFREKKPLSWDEYYKKEMLFSLSTEEIFMRRKTMPFQTTPLYDRIQNFNHNANFQCVGDLPFDTYILAFSLLRLSTFWVYNRKEKHKAANLTDLLMASTAIPIIFPNHPIRPIPGTSCSLPKGDYLDGGTSGSFKRFKQPLMHYVKANGSFDTMYIISPMREVSTEDFDELDSLLPSNDLLKLNSKDFTLLKSFLEMISMNGFDSFLKAFHTWINTSKRKIANEIVVCVPKLEKNYPILNFSRQEEQYNCVRKWAALHPNQLAIPLSEYVNQMQQDYYISLKKRIDSTGLILKFKHFFQEHFLKFR